jgi:DNA-binding MarR family transcriptional regulator
MGNSRVGQAVMHKELVRKLAEFGFTVNQAKVYLCIVQSGKTYVSQISKCTLLHRQDIYKLLPKLEKMELITRTLDNPVMIEALPVERALERLIKKEQEANDKRIALLQRNLSEIAEEINQQPKIAKETRFTLLTTNVALRNRINITLSAKPAAFKVVSSIENLKGQVGKFYKKFFQMLADNKTEIQLLLVGAESAIELGRIMGKIAPRGGCFNVKAIEKCSSRDYLVVDGCEVWIATQLKISDEYPSILWTNDQNIIETYTECFAEAWRNPKAVKLCKDEDIPGIVA